MIETPPDVLQTTTGLPPLKLAVQYVFGGTAVPTPTEQSVLAGGDGMFVGTVAEQ